ncbi:hypothetical protein THRCLA_03049 [Thraustotheca clavata]|uniref:Uncharacterized protein n=1 Tax=Thraustotheca clavata TaxID=74557 RepID=A0A1W0A3B1_9STRA|nr:hypothetical protein THRCLA_03049 [Thraustotheca clavata]
METMANERLFLSALDAYESSSSGNELNALQSLLQAAFSESQIAPATIVRLLRVLHIGSSAALEETYKLLLSLFVLSKPFENDAQAIALLYEFIMDKFLVVNHQTSPYGSILFAFGLFLRRVEQKESLYEALVAILKARKQTEAVEFEMEDSLCELVLEKGRLLGGLFAFASSLETLAPLNLVYSLENSVWQPQEPAKNTLLLQNAGFTFVSGFAMEFELLDFSKWESEWLTILELYAPLLHQNTKLIESTYTKSCDKAIALSALFPYRLLPQLKFLTIYCAPRTISDIIAQAQTATMYTNTVSPEVPVESIDASEDSWVVCTENYIYSNDNFTIPVGTKGQKLKLANDTVVCWHLEQPYAIWPILLHRLKTTQAIAEVSTILNFLTKLLSHCKEPSFLQHLEHILLELVGLMQAPSTAPLIKQACIAYCSALASIKQVGLVIKHVPVDALVATLETVLAAREYFDGHYPSVLNILQLSNEVFKSKQLDSPWAATMVQVVFNIITSYKQWRYSSSLHLIEEEHIGLACFQILYTLLEMNSKYASAITNLFQEKNSSFQQFVLDSISKFLPMPKEFSKPVSPKTFAFDDTTKETLPFLPIKFSTESNSKLQHLFIETVFRCVYLVSRPLFNEYLANPEKAKEQNGTILHATSSLSKHHINWPLLCVAYFASPDHKVVDLAVDILTELIVILPKRSFVSCFTTPQDIAALVDAIWKLLNEVEHPKRQAKIFHFLSLSVDLQPSLLSLLLYKNDSQLTRELLQIIEKAITIQDWSVTAHGLDLIRVSYPLFAHETILWSKLGKFLLCDETDLPESSDHWYSIGIFWQLIALESQNRKIKTSPELDSLLKSIPNDDWLRNLIEGMTQNPKQHDRNVPLTVRRAAIQSSCLFAYVQFGNAIEILLHPSQKSQIINDHVQLAWVCTIILAMTNQHVILEESALIHYLQTSTQLCLTLLSHITSSASSLLDMPTSVELVKCILSILQSIARNAASEGVRYLLTCLYLVMRHMTVLKTKTAGFTNLPSIIVAPLLAYLSVHLDKPSTPLYGLILQQFVTEWMSPLYSHQLSPCLGQLANLITVETKVEIVIDTLTCLVEILRASPQESREYCAKELNEQYQIVSRIKAIAQPLTSAMLRRKIRGYDGDARCHLHLAWVKLLDLITLLLQLNCTEALTTLPYLQPVLLSAFEPSPTMALIQEQGQIGYLLLAASSHLHEWQSFMPVGSLLELGRCHIVAITTWKQDDSKPLAITTKEKKDSLFQKGYDRQLWGVTYLWCVLLFKLTPSLSPEVEINGRSVVDAEAARPILDYLPISMATASAPCSLGHIARLVKCALKESKASPSAEIKRMEKGHRDFVEAATALLVANYLLHEQRYSHPTTYRAELKISIADIVTCIKSDWGSQEPTLLAFVENLHEAILNQPQQ